MPFDNVLLAIVILVVLYFIYPWLGRRTDPDVNQTDCRDSKERQEAQRSGSRPTAKSQTASGVVRVIRLTDDGEFADRCELTDAVYEIRNCTRAVLAVWYIHGWKHNAEECDSDYKKFKELIKKLNERQPADAEGRDVVGVYVGWDGLVGPRIPLLNNITFWNRKFAADRISQSQCWPRLLPRPDTRGASALLNTASGT